MAVKGRAQRHAPTVPLRTVGVHPRAVEALRTDVVLTLHQLERYHAVGRRGLGHLPFRELQVYPVYMNTAVSSVERFYALDPRVLERATVSELGHLAGTAEIRQQLRARPEQWRVVRRGPVTVPDAQYRPASGGVVAIEYDTGSYSSQVVKRKVEAFTLDCTGIVWGAVSAMRRERLQFRYPAVTVLDARWWSRP
ncbi:replication-relaxation family protein [Deinococcus sonorensis]|uniref:Replication-relaxation family protein n=1 Tax=Deinococcus sonorensis TaxID=309891 RepID=A0ABV8YBN9_9DEIO